MVAWVKKTFDPSGAGNNMVDNLRISSSEEMII